MSKTDIFEQIKQALEQAPRNQYTAELHLQMIKYSDELKHITSKEFCEGVGLRLSFVTEFSKMRNLPCLPPHKVMMQSNLLIARVTSFYYTTRLQNDT